VIWNTAPGAGQVYTLAVIIFGWHAIFAESRFSMELKIKIPLWMDVVLAMVVLAVAIYAVSQGLSTI
jgi:hypothetical protein